ncbi:hypothetical protein DLAC_06808 [Tieghemostelium lacteum]|uniref:Uncharacterized protein n=1 Tax=Tieghemostelium lacteum TaxID=361077 RepID=A0A151ZDG4_TIELA|nr:hypothetical protein DLAC_06808 [Tieghemostelium lacteum]|eukprot:KYQ91987.1 hypothetical protein DLAC_06808 [Tieghemostelium lacteum]
MSSIFQEPTVNAHRRGEADKILQYIKKECQKKGIKNVTLMLLGLKGSGKSNIYSLLHALQTPLLHVLRNNTISGNVKSGTMVISRSPVPQLYLDPIDFPGDIDHLIDVFVENIGTMFYQKSIPPQLFNEDEMTVKKTFVSKGKHNITGTNVVVLVIDFRTLLLDHSSLAKLVRIAKAMNSSDVPYMIIVNRFDADPTELADGAGAGEVVNNDNLGDIHNHGGDVNTQHFNSLTDPKAIQIRLQEIETKIENNFGRVSVCLFPNIPGRVPFVPNHDIPDLAWNFFVSPDTRFFSHLISTARASDPEHDYVSPLIVKHHTTKLAKRYYIEIIMVTAVVVVIISVIYYISKLKSESEALKNLRNKM